MINRGMKNKDIQFFFNRPDRSVNSGRISGIRNGTYSDSSAIVAASDAALDAFLAEFQPSEVGVAISGTSQSAPEHSTGPIAANTIGSMFILGEDGVWRFRYAESERHECKESFGFKHSDKWLRAVAALANNKGGYVIFGVRESGGKDSTKGGKKELDLVGLKTTEFESADPVEFTKRLKATFDPTPVVEVATLEVGEQKIGALYVHPHASRPVIAVHNEGSLVKEGDIYFRYPGQSSRIKYSDLRAIFDERDRQARAEIMPMIEKLLSLGPDKSMIADLEHGTLADGTRSIVIGEDLLDRIRFIREGEFRESEGAPTLRLIGDVQAVDAIGHPIRRGFVTANDLVDDFLAQQTPYDPKEYIRCAVEGGNGAWVPMHYFASRAKLGSEGLKAYIMATNAPQTWRALYARRAEGKVSAYSASGGQASQLLAELEKGYIPDIKDIKAAASFGRAVAALKKKPKAELADMLNTLKICVDMVRASTKASWLSPIRRGIARLDELYFGDGNWEAS